MNKKTRMTKAAVKASMRTFAGLWNEGKMAQACKAFADDALFVSGHGTYRGRSEIYKNYRRFYPDRSEMGILTLRLVTYQPIPGSEAATSILEWKLTWPDQPDRKPEAGETIETCAIIDGNVRIVFDSSK